MGLPSRVFGNRYNGPTRAASEAQANAAASEVIVERAVCPSTEA